MKDMQYSDDPYLKELNKALLKINEIVHLLPFPKKPSDLDSEYSFPNRIDALPNDALADWSLQLSGWRGYVLAELSRVDSKRRILKSMYEYLYKILLSDEKYKVLSQTGLIEDVKEPEVNLENGEKSKKTKSKNIRLYEILEDRCKESVRKKAELLSLTKEMESNDILYTHLKYMDEVLKDHSFAISREISRRQTDARVFQGG